MSVCVICGKRRRWVSKRGVCKPCADKRVTEVCEQLQAKSGLWYARWQAGVIAAKSKTEWRRQHG